MSFDLQYIASVIGTSHASPNGFDKVQPETSTSSNPDGFDEVEPSTSTSSNSDGLDEVHPSTSNKLDVLQPDADILVHTQSQGIQVYIPNKGTDFGCQFNARGDRLMMASFGTQTPTVLVCEASTQVEDDIMQIEAPKMEEEANDEDPTETASPGVSPQKDPLYLPPKVLSDDSTVSESEDEGVENSKGITINAQDDTKFIVFKQELMELLNRCPTCGAVVIEKQQSTQGTQLFVTLTCINGHNYLWKSQPMLDGMAAGNLLTSASILLSGSSYTKVASLADILKLKFLSERSYYNIQDQYLLPVINESWEKEQKSVFEKLGDKELWLSGDGRCDSPGHNAKYGTYTMIDQETDKIVDFNIVQVSEVSSSNAMEREGFKRCMDNIQTKGGKIKVVATDRHVGIRADMKRNYPEIEHQFDVWHLSKSITKKLTEKAKKKDCSELSPWIKSISNHLWWCAETCEGDKELLREKWISIVYHTANIHSWDSADTYHQCAHPPIPRDVARTKRWLRPGSPAHEALKEVVFDKNLLKDIQQLSLCCHTGNLEVYHSVQTKYVPKRQHFSYKGMVARTQLTALDHNTNTGRKQATATKGANQGELQYKLVFPKHTKEWVAKPVLEKKSNDHLKPMLDAIIDRKKQKPQERSATLTATHIPKNIASKPRPPRAEVIAKHTSRFSND